VDAPVTRRMPSGILGLHAWANHNSLTEAFQRIITSLTFELLKDYSGAVSGWPDSGPTEALSGTPAVRQASVDNQLRLHGAGLHLAAGIIAAATPSSSTILRRHATPSLWSRAKSFLGLAVKRSAIVHDNYINSFGDRQPTEFKA
jgi:hypothetical protein